jgi:DNA primase
MNLIEEIKSKINIVDVARKAGLNPDKNGFIKSIYKAETKPSLKLYEKTNTFCDFSTGKSGDVINFYADLNGLSIKEAVRELAVKAGLHYGRSERLEVRSKKKITPKRIEKRVPILKSEFEYFEERAAVYEYMMELDRRKAEINAIEDLMNERKETQNLVYDSLEKFCYGVDDETYNYLQGKARGLTAEVIKRFRLFAIKDLKMTYEYLKECFTADELLISGLMNKNGKLVFSYHKLIIPYLENNKIVYLRGRRIQPSTELSKYISLSNYTGNLPLKRFFNIDTLKRIKEKERLIVCEGEFDTMIMEQEGFAAIGIPGVTNIPAEQIGTIKKYDLYIAFDNDEAGEIAMQKIVKLVNRPIKGIKLKHHNDLTELINERRNRENI